MILHVTSIVFPIFAIVAVGYFYGRRSRPHMAVINRANMDVFLPALVFHVLSREDFTPLQYGELAFAGCMVILGSGVLAYVVAGLFDIDWRTLVPPMMFTNYGNLGLPLFVLAFGKDALSAAVVLFIVGNTLHFSLGRYLLDHSIHPIGLLRTPIMLTAIFGLVFSFTGLQLPNSLALPIEMLGQVSIPLMLFSLGVRLMDVDWRDWKLGLLGACLCPMSGVAIALGLILIMQLSDAQARQLLLFGALPPAILNYLFAEQFDQEPHKVASVVTIGTLASVFVIPLMLIFLLEPI